jgi:ribosomal protein S18 acetylase RimI-like enzyme
MDIRSAKESEIATLARIWFDGWQDAHAAILPAALKADRTLESFERRLRADLSQVRVTGAVGAPTGFVMLKADELYQLYVAGEARGLGVAAALTDDAEQLLANAGVETAWLACAIGNDRAARFYEKRGWHRVATMVSQLDTAKGVFPLEVWRYEKELTPPG